MKISFLVTYYNQEEFVRQSLDSILAIEKPEEWEILIGDDGSTDGTVSIVNEYIMAYPGRISLYFMPREPGKEYDSVRRASANRLNLLAHCTGDCFCALDGDDFYSDTLFVRDSINTFENHPDAAVVMFGYRLFKDGKFTEDNLLPKGSGQLINTRDYINSWYLHAGAGVYRMLWGEDRIDYIKQIGFFDDNDIVINSLNYGSMYYYNRAIYAYRQTGDSIYTGMGKTEQAFLNVMGYDVDRKLIDASYDENLIIRNAFHFVRIYFSRNRLRDIFGERKFQKYLESCALLEGAVSYDLLRQSGSDRGSSEQIDKIMDIIRNNKPFAYWVHRIKYMFRRIDI